MKYDVFISYSHKDKSLAKRITEFLEAEGITYFIDWKDIGGGEQYTETIPAAIKDASVVLFIASISSYKSPYVYREVKYAQEKNPGHILPLLADSAEMPERFQFILGDSNFRYLDKTPVDSVLINDIKHSLGKRIENNKSESILNRQSILVTIAECLQVVFFLCCFGYLSGLFAEGSYLIKHPIYTVTLLTVLLEILILASAGFTIGLMNKSRASFFVICVLDVLELLLMYVVFTELNKRTASIKVINSVYRDVLMYGRMFKDSFQLIATIICIPLHILAMRVILMIKKKGISAWVQLN